MAAGEMADRPQLPGLYRGQFSRQKAAWHIQIPHARAYLITRGSDSCWPQQPPPSLQPPGEGVRSWKLSGQQRSICHFFSHDNKPRVLHGCIL